MERLELRVPLPALFVFALAIWAVGKYFFAANLALPGRQTIALISILFGLAAVLLFCAYLTRFQIIPEERMMLKLCGAEYVAYLNQVRR